MKGKMDRTDERNVNNFESEMRSINMIKLYEIDYRLSEYNTVNTCLMDGRSKKDAVRKFWLLSPNCKIVITDIREIVVV